MIDNNTDNSNIISRFLEEEMSGSFVDYALYVIMDRAIPDVRDGLKPVHRRIVYGMLDGGYTYDKGHKKSARVVGDVMGKYHPHGDTSIYDAMVRMAQPWVMMHPLIDGQGNFGSPEGDSPAAMRYTEARLGKIADHVLGDIQKDVVDYAPNYDDTTVEPVVLPCEFPNILVNGGSGVAVGFATNIPPHNLGEVIDATIAYVRNPDSTTAELIQYVPAPDFPTGGFVSKGNNLKIYETGQGGWENCGDYNIERNKDGSHSIVLTTFPYLVNKATFLVDLAEQIKDKGFGITDMRNESGRDGDRVVIDVKRGFDADVVVAFLKDKTEFRKNQSMNMTCLDPQKRPILMGLKKVLQEFVTFRVECVTRSVEFDLNKARTDLMKQIGLFAATSRMDEVVKTIRASKKGEEARTRLMEMAFDTSDELGRFLREIDPDIVLKDTYHLTTEQADVILGLALRQLTGLEQELIVKKCRELSKSINNFTKILNSKKMVLDIIVTQLEAIKAKYATPRKTKIVDQIERTKFEIASGGQDVLLQISAQGYVRALPSKSSIKPDLKPGDVFTHNIETNTNETLIIFTDMGNYYPIKVSAIENKSRAFVNFVNVPIVGKHIAYFTTSAKDEHLMFVTDFGDVRRSALNDFAKSRTNVAMKLETGRLVSILKIGNDDTVVMASQNGMAIRFPVSTTNLIGSKDSTGVKAMKLKDDDKVVSAFLLNNVELDMNTRVAYLNGGTGEYNGEKTTLNAQQMADIKKNEVFLTTVTNTGYVKKFSFYELSISGRNVGGVKVVHKNDTLFGMFVSSNFETNEGVIENEKVKIFPRDNRGVKMLDNVEFLTVLE